MMSNDWNNLCIVSNSTQGVPDLRHLKELMEGFTRHPLPSPYSPLDLFRWDNLANLQVVTDDQLTERVWEFPEDKFIEYGPEDLWWAVKYGFGRWVDKPIYKVYQIGSVLIMHPDILYQIKQDHRFVIFTS